MRAPKITLLWLNITPFRLACGTRGVKSNPARSGSIAGSAMGIFLRLESYSAGRKVFKAQRFAVNNYGGLNSAAMGNSAIAFRATRFGE